LDAAPTADLADDAASKDRLLPRPFLRAVYPTSCLGLGFSESLKWNVWLSVNGGESYILVDGYWMYGDGRLFAPMVAGNFTSSSA